MKTIILLALALPSFAFGQVVNTPYTPYQYLFSGSISHYNPLSFEHQLLKSVKGTTIKEVKKTSITKNGKRVRKSTFTFNDFNKPTGIQHDDFITTIEYENDTLVKKISTQRKKELNTVNFSYLDGKLALQESFTDDKMTARSLNQYNEDGNIMYSSLTRGKRRKNHSMMYSYEGSEVVQQRYMKNEKIVRVWNFSCNPAGEDVASEIQSKICKYREENEDGSYVEFSREEKDGDVFLVKRYFNKEENVVKAQSFLNDSILIWESTYSDNEFHRTNYTKKHKKKSVRHIKFDDQKRVLESTWQYGPNPKKYSKVMYAYNDDGTVADEKAWYKEKLTRHITFEYTK